MEYLKKMDIFGYKFKLKIEKENSYKSICGAFGSLCFLALTILLIYYK